MYLCMEMNVNNGGTTPPPHLYYVCLTLITTMRQKRVSSFQSPNQKRLSRTVLSDSKQFLCLIDHVCSSTFQCLKFLHWNSFMKHDLVTKEIYLDHSKRPWKPSIKRLKKTHFFVTGWSSDTCTVMMELCLSSMLIMDGHEYIQLGINATYMRCGGPSKEE